jgi:hypothetical protein
LLIGGDFGFIVCTISVWPTGDGTADLHAALFESIRRWWREMGQVTYPNVRRLLITADGGGSNGHRVRLWRQEL